MKSKIGTNVATPNDLKLSDSRAGSLQRMVRPVLFRLSIMRGVRATLLPVRGQPLAIKLSPGRRERASDREAMDW